MTYTGPVVFPDFGPHDTAEDKAALLGDYGASWYVWYTTAWRTDYKDPYFYPPCAESAAELREQLDRKMAAAIPVLRAQLREAEAAVERGREFGYTGASKALGARAKAAGAEGLAPRVQKSR
jgi:hypothetical protein